MMSMMKVTCPVSVKGEKMTSGVERKREGKEGVWGGASVLIIDPLG